jgi:hypothetical protein
LQFALLYPPLIAWAVVSLCLLVSPLQAQSLHITLLNGDCDGDNEVTLFDFGIVVSAMGSVPGDPNWDPRADLDGDGEVTLFDVGLVERNFGKVGAEPFDPTLPRLPAPSEGYALQGSVELQDWVGEPQPVRIEALREEDPDQVVYWIEAQTGQTFTLQLPASGRWWVRAVVVGVGGHFLASKQADFRRYGPGEPVRVTVVYPGQGEVFGDGSVNGGGDTGVRIRIHAEDYDEVTYTSADGTVTFSNSVKTPVYQLLARWTVESGGGWVYPDLHVAKGEALYRPPVLPSNEPQRTVTLRCDILDHGDYLDARDRSPDAGEEGENVAATTRITFTIARHPTIQTIDSAVLDAATDFPLGVTPTSSGARPEEQVKLRFAVSSCIGHPALTDWRLKSVEWKTIPWEGTPAGEAGEVYTTNIIPSSEPHGFFEVKVEAVFERYIPIPPYRIQVVDYKTRRFPLCFRKSTHDEWIDTARGISLLGSFNPPNWFDSRPGHAGHWGDAFERFNERGASGEYIVHYMPTHPRSDLQGAVALFDWAGALAPAGHQYEIPYRGRIYLIGSALLAYTDNAPTRGWLYGILAGGIDYLGAVLAHEFAHRDTWLEPNNWGGFEARHIGGPREFGGPGYWFPYSGSWGRTRDNTDPYYDRDMDGVRDRFERLNVSEYHLSPDIAWAIERWWTGNSSAQTRYGTDIEMLALLWGEWTGYRIGTKDMLDWSVEGRQDYFSQ